jgi:hypothetical protein
MSTTRSSARTERRLYTGAAARTLVRDRAAFFQAAPVSPKEPPRGVPVSSRRGLGELPAAQAALIMISSRQPTGVVLAGRSGSGSGSDGQAAESAARAALRGRLDPVWKVLTATKLGVTMSDQPDPASEWWTTSDVASYLDLKVATVSAYRARGQMPEPDMTLGRTHVWKPERIITWHESRSRAGVGGRPTEVQDPSTTTDE